MNETESSYFRSLPLIIQPTTLGKLAEGELKHLTDLVTRDRDSLKRQLTHHGALLFRGYGVDSTADF